MARQGQIGFHDRASRYGCRRWNTEREKAGLRVCVGPVSSLCPDAHARRAIRLARSWSDASFVKLESCGADNRKLSRCRSARPFGRKKH
jgi:hypothetical protein